MRVDNSSLLNEKGSGGRSAFIEGADPTSPRLRSLVNVCAGAEKNINSLAVVIHHRHEEEGQVPKAGKWFAQLGLQFRVLLQHPGDPVAVACANGREKLLQA